MDAREALDNDGAPSEMPRLQCRMLAAAALAVVLVANDNPALPLGLVLARHIGNTLVLLCQHVEHAVGLAVCQVDCADEHVVGDVVEVSAVLEPRPCGADVVRRALALGLRPATAAQASTKD